MIELRDDLRERGWTSSLPERLFAKVEKTATCWLWTGATNGDGYGKIRPGGRAVPSEYVHRVAYELLVGPIPAGLTIDHVRARGCTSRACVNPAHLEAVSYRENTLRGDHPSAVAHRTGKCSNGHLHALHAGRHPNGTVAYCRPCLSERRRAA